MTTGHLKCKYLLIWLRNMQNCKMPKIDISSQVLVHEKLQFFRLSEKDFKMMKITSRWPLKTWNVNICSFGWEICKTVKCPKLTFFRGSTVMKNFNFFDFLKRLLKWWKIATRWPLDTWNVNICSFGWEICKTVKCPKLTFFRRFSFMKNFNSFDFLKRLLKWWKSPPDHHWTLEMWIFAHLVEKYAKQWIPKIDIFSQVRGHEKLQSFRLSEKPFKMMKITTSWPQDTWNVNICSFGWEICKTVKCPKMTIFRRSAVMKIFKFFDFLESLLKWWNSPPDDHWTLEM